MIEDSIKQRSKKIRWGKENQMKLGRPTLCLLTVAFLWMGCTTAHVQWTREMRTQLNPHEAVTIVASREAGGQEDLSFATEAIGCITAGLRAAYPALNIVPADEFYRTAFPDLTVEVRPPATTYLSQLDKDSKFRERIARLGLRYLISVAGETDQRAKPIFGAAGGPGGAVTVLGAEWDRISNVTATILDLKGAAKAGDVQASASGHPWVVCVGFGPLCAPIGAPAFTESKACKELGEGVVKFLKGENDPDLAFVYDKDDRVLYSYNTKADPAERYRQALGRLKHPLNEIEKERCPSLKTCVDQYLAEARRRAKEVGYTRTPGDEKAFQLDLEIAQDVDDGKITKEEAVRLRWPPTPPTIFQRFYEVSQHCRAREYGEQRKVSPNFYNAMHKLTDRLLDEIKDNRDTMRDAVAAYIEEFRKLTIEFNHTLTCADEATFQLEVEIAKDTDEGKLTKEEGLNQLRTITTRHLINLYFGRS